MEGRYVDKALQLCDFNSAATRLYKQQLIPPAIYTAMVNRTIKLLLYSREKWA